MCFPEQNDVQKLRFIITCIEKQIRSEGKWHCHYRKEKEQDHFTCIKNAISITRWLRYPRTRLTTPLATVDDPISTPS